jgi:hypothetical protein
MAKLLIFTLVFLFCAGQLMAGTTGKIAGVVTDNSTGDPLVGANVVIVDQAMGAAVDPDGDFYILNVPPGVYTLEVTMMGYATTQLTDVRVFIDRTTPLDIQLESTTLEAEEITVVAPRIVVKRDVSQSEISASGDQIDDTPVVQDVTSYMNLQAGIHTVISSGFLEEDDEEAEEMQIRGGGMDQVGMVVDGLTMTNNINGEPIDIVNLSAIQEVSIIKGGFNAEYGNIRSGLFNVVTKEADKNYHASVDFRYTFAQQKHRGAGLFDFENYHVRPYVDPAVCWVGTQNGAWDEYTQSQYLTFTGWNAFTEQANNDENPLNDMTPQQARNLYIWQHRLEGSKALGHPHAGEYGDKPDLNMDLSFSGPVPFISDYLGNLRFFASYRYNEEQYVYPTQLDAFITNNWMVKINSNISESMKLGLEVMFGKEEDAGEVDMSDRGAYFAHNESPMDIYTRVYGLTFDHVLSPDTYYKFRLSFVNVENDANKWRTLRDTTILRTFGTYPVDEQPWGFFNDPGYFYAFGGDKKIMGGVGGEYINQNVVNTINAKVDYTSQVNKYNQVQAGVEFIYDDFDIYEEVDGFDVTSKELVEWEETPFRLQAYLQNKLEYQEFVANVGLRLDYNDANTKSYLVSPWSGYFTKRLKFRLLDEGESKNTEAQIRLSPRLGIAHPITATSKLYFNYGHFYDSPNSYDMYQINFGNPNTHLAVIGNPGLEPRKTIAYELGYEHDLEDLFLLRLTGYYKDVSNEIGEVEYAGYLNRLGYSTFNNDHYADIRGFEFELRRDWGAWVTGWLNYTLMVQTDGFVGKEVYHEYPQIDGKNYENRNPVVEKPLPRPYANANFRIMTPEKWGPVLLDNHILDRISLNFLGSWSTGEYLTHEPFVPIKTQENNLQWKDIWNLDLRISKFFTIDQYEFNIFLDIINVFDFKYLTGAGFESEQDALDYLNSLHLPEYKKEKYENFSALTGGDDQVGDVRSKDKPYIDMPNMDFLAWSPPRSIIFGFRIGF